MDVHLVKVGDLVALGPGRFAEVLGHEQPDIVVALERCTGMTWRIVDPVPPLRPDAPGQRVRCVGGPVAERRAAEPEPFCVDRMEWGRATEQAGAPCPLMARSLYEPVWTARGRGVVVSHPTREGAIAAWREAVRRG